jgi:AraC-like DNA-binding protein
MRRTRWCLDAFGYGPSVWRRIPRFRTALRLASRGVPVAVTAVRAGYADQAHLAREVRALAGVPLGQLLTVSCSRSADGDTRGRGARHAGLEGATREAGERAA